MRQEGVSWATKGPTLRKRSDHFAFQHSPTATSTGDIPGALPTKRRKPHFMLGDVVALHANVDRVFSRFNVQVVKKWRRPAQRFSLPEQGRSTVHERDYFYAYRIEVDAWGPVLVSKRGLRSRYVLCKKVVSAIEPPVLDDNLHRVEPMRSWS